jgi:hypothetical protein
MAWQNNWCARGWAFGSRVLAYGMQMRKDEKIVLVRVSMEFHYTSCVFVIVRFCLMSGGFIKIEGTTIPKLECHVLFMNKRWIYSSMWLLIGIVTKLNIILEERFDTNAMKMSSSGFWLMFWQ